ncbi:NmrA-like family protein [Hypoxylon rubiginosum]|uniref:NmrA-like family protein n=1 Tax=Hypoxylon rubiginosum TaxID=110542 RepID=A0ACB9YHJ9_9PEZI|nr:NmrA-like family protein [Hypoxylon rubiginosum]
MVVVAVAGGTGDLGRLIVDSLLKREQHEVYVISRRLVKNLTGRNGHTVKRFIPSEFNVDYDLGDDILPYPEKRLHTAARRELEKTSLEFTYIYPGMFMDYYGMPYIETHLRPLPGWFDEASNTVMITGEGNTYCVMSYTKDVARYTALALELDKWPRVLKIISSRLTENELAALLEKNLGRKLTIEHGPVEYIQNNRTTLLEPDDPIATHFPGGAEQLSALIADLGLSMTFGAYDFASIEGLDLVKAFDGKTEPPLRIEQLMEMAWKGR